MNPSAWSTACLLDGRGGARSIDPGWPGGRQPGDGVLWVHMNRESAECREWLQTQSGLEGFVVDALLAGETRPRCVVAEKGVMVILRGVNLNPGADPEDMVSIRVWIEESRILSVHLRRLLTVDDLQADLANGRGPRTSGEFLVALSAGLVFRMTDVISDIDDEVDRMQTQVVEGKSRELRLRLAEVRRQIIELRRYLAPQRDAMQQLCRLDTGWLPAGLVVRLREEADRVTRFVEELDAARERAAVTQEELASRLSEQMNNRMYVLSLVAGIFLPLGLLTGLLGINVGGIPGTEHPAAFLLVVVLLVGIGVLEWVIFKWKKWF